MARFISTCLHARHAWKIGRLSWSESCYTIPHGIVLSNRGLLGSSLCTLHLVVFAFVLFLLPIPSKKLSIVRGVLGVFALQLEIMIIV